MTLEEAKEQVARQYTGGKHGWYDDYLTSRIKLLLMDDVAKIYAKSQLAKYREALDRIADPISYMKSELKEGESLNGAYAIRIASDGRYLSEIAKEALKQ